MKKGTLKTQILTLIKNDLVKGNLDNDLTALPPEIGNLVNLEELYLAKNLVKEIPQKLKDNPNLDIYI